MSDKDKGVWYGPLGETEIEEWHELEESYPGAARIEAEDTPEPWAVIESHLPENALPALTSAIALDARTVGTFETIQRKEALRRLKMLEAKGLHPNVAREFEAAGELNRSDRTKLGGVVFGALFWLTEAETERVKKLEEKYGFLVYHATSESTEFGKLLDLLIVTSNVEEWPTDRADLDRGVPFSYVVNETCDDLSKFGCIGIKVSGGGVIRTD